MNTAVQIVYDTNHKLNGAQTLVFLVSMELKYKI